MKKNLILAAILAFAAILPATSRDNIFSRLRGQKTSATPTAHSAGQKADSIYNSVSRLYDQRKISADSLVSLALFHKAGNPELAERCLNLVADNHPRAMTELGVIYLFNPKFSSRAADGLKLLERAAKAGYKDADNYLGFYYYGKKDYKKAKEYFDASMPATSGFAYAAMGGMHMEGKGVAKDLSKALDDYRQASLKGYPRGMALYASMISAKDGGALNYPDAFFWHYIAGDLGDNYSRVTLYRPMLPEEQSSDEVHRDAQTALALIEMSHANRNFKNDPLYRDGFLAGLKSREQAAEQGDDWARYYLGSMNYNGDFLNQNYSRALYYYEPIAANAKLPDTLLAMVNLRLAEMYRDGKGTKANSAKAERYLRDAARYGSLSAYKALRQTL